MVGCLDLFYGQSETSRCEVHIMDECRVATGHPEPSICTVPWRERSFLLAVLHLSRCAG